MLRIRFTINLFLLMHYKKNLITSQKLVMLEFVHREAV